MHELLSPSSAHSWLNCTRAPRLEAALPEKFRHLMISSLWLSGHPHFCRLKT
ncbi:MAG: DUF2800 domain-containing protein [Selenomonadaceae bacterium]|nr:DUF2800 domain-containing protein [Selenomonadaceae bacterium]